MSFSYLFTILIVYSVEAFRLEMAKMLRTEYKSRA